MLAADWPEAYVGIHYINFFMEVELDRSSVI